MHIKDLFRHYDLKIEDIDDVIISSVVPDVMHSLENFARKYCDKEAMVVGPGIKTGLNIKYDNPRQVGADRIVNAVAAIEKYGYPLIIVDFGTATTFCAISESGEYLGRKYCDKEAMVVGPGIKTGLNIKYDNPRQVGADRIVNAVAAIEKYGYPLIIVDFGTATTFCAISESGEYLGGTIAPGVKISSEALFQRASKLPRVELIKPGTVIAKNTVSAMQAGLIYGYVGLVDKIIEMMKDELKNPDVKVIATGGLAGLISSETDSIDEIDKFLTLEGLRMIYEKNKENDL